MKTCPYVLAAAVVLYDDDGRGVILSRPTYCGLPVPQGRHYCRQHADEAASVLEDFRSAVTTTGPAPPTLPSFRRGRGLGS